MTRPLRIQYPGALYHIMSRGVGGGLIFNDSMDYEKFLELYKNVLLCYNWISYSYCLMPNHYHIFIKTIDPNLSLGIKQLNSSYSRNYNIRKDRCGHLFQARFKSVLVQNLSYQGELMRYIALNPVKASLVKSPEDWKWSSYKELLTDIKGSNCVDVHEALKFFSENKIEARKNYVKFINEASNKKIDKIKKSVHSGFIMGSKDFIIKIANKYGNSRSIEVVKRERYASRPSLEQILTDTKKKELRDKQISKAFLDYGYTQIEIAKKLNIHYSTICRILKKVKIQDLAPINNRCLFNNSFLIKFTPFC